MPQEAWSKKRERQYEHVKDGLLDRGESEDTAAEIAARTVNKERARSGEAEEASKDLHRRHLVGAPGRAAQPPGQEAPVVGDHRRIGDFCRGTPSGAGAPGCRRTPRVPT